MAVIYAWSITGGAGKKPPFRIHQVGSWRDAWRNGMRRQLVEVDWTSVALHLVTARAPELHKVTMADAP